MRLKLHVFALIIALGSVFSGSVFGQVTIAGWEMNGVTAYGASSFTASTAATNSTVGPLTKGSGLTAVPTAAGNAWGGTGVDQTSSANAITNNDFVTFTVKSNTGYTLSLTQISPYNIRKTAAGSTSGLWQYSVNGGAYTNIGSTITWGSTTSATGNSQPAISLTGISALQSLPSTTTITFRLLIWGATSTSGSWYFNNFQTGNDFVVTGTVDAVGGCTNPVINSATPTQPSCGTPTGSIAVSATGTSLEYSVDNSTWQSGSTITGLAANTYSVYVRSTSSCVVTYGSTVTINAAPTPASDVTNTTLTASGLTGSAFTTYTVTGNNSPTSFSASGLPSGLSINTSNGQITGTPTAAGTFNVTIGASNTSCGQGITKTLVITISTPCTTPSPATALNFTTVTSSQINGSFTGSGASAYLVIRSTSSTPPTVTDGSTFTGNATYVVVQSSASTSFTNSGLTANTPYYFYIYAYNNTSCAGGPKYASALTDNVSTTPLATTVQFTSASATVTEGTNATYTLTVSITNPSGSNATSATVSLGSGNARVGGFTSQVLTWAAGDNLNKTVVVTVTNNSTCDGPANLSFSLGSVSGGTTASAGTQSSFALTVNDNDLTTNTPFGQGFESGGGTTNNWSFSGTGSTTTDSERSGTNGRELNNGDVDTYNSINITGYTNSIITLYNEGIGGLENTADRLEIYVALNGAAFSATPEATIRACQTTPSNVSWDYSANGVASKTVNGSNTNFDACSSINGRALVQLTVPDGNTSVAIQIKAFSNSGGEGFNYDDLTFSGSICTTPVPVITTSTAGPLNFGSVGVGSTSAEQSYTVSGSDLTGDIIVNPPAGYEISLTSGSGFSTGNIILTPTTGTVSSTTIFVRFAPGSTGALNGNIEHTSTGAVQKDVAVTGTGTAPCVVPSNQATGLVLTPTSASVGGSFTAASGGADGYLVVYSTNNTLSSGPVNTTTYTAGQSLGGGIVAGVGSGTTFNVSPLTVSTQYYFFVFAYNSACTGGPVYKSPALTGSTTTLTSPVANLDDFTRTDNFAVGNGWTESETHSEIIRVENGQLYMFRDNGQAGQSGREYMYRNVSSLYSTTYDNATSKLVWAFNMRSTRSSPSGFALGNYGTAFILGSTASDVTGGNGNGYAVVIGGSVSGNYPVRLVRFTGGLDINTDITNNIVSWISGNETAYFSIEVTYDPATGVWELFARNDNGISSVDPTTVTSTHLRGTGTDVTYTDTDLPYLGLYWNRFTGGTSFNEYAVFDNVWRPTAQACTQNTWTGAVSTDWFDAGNWSCGMVPTSIHDVVIPNVSSTTNRFPNITGIIGQTASVKGLTINAGASVTIAGLNNVNLEVYGDYTNNGAASLGTGKVVLRGTTGAQTINGSSNFKDLTINNGDGVSIGSGAQKVSGILALTAGALTTNSRLTISSDAAGAGMIDDFTGGNGTISGNITVERYAVNPNNGFYYIGTPVAGTTLADWSADFANSPINGANDNTPVIPVGCSFTNLASNSPYGGLFEYRETAVTGCSLDGWYTRFTGSIPAGKGFAGRVPNGTTINLTGTYVTGNQTSPSMTVTGANTVSQGFNLMANPYASPLDWLAVNTTNSGKTDGAAYVYHASGPYSGTYAAINNIGGGSKLIGSSQAFFVDATTHGTTLSFTNSMRSTIGANPYLRTGQPYEQLLILDMAGNGYADMAHIAFGSNFTPAFDNSYDAKKMKVREGQPSLYIVDGIVKHSIYAQPSPQQVQHIPVTFEAGANGTFTINALELSTFDPTALVFLEDKRDNVMQNLMVTPSYSFTADVTDAPERFVLHFVPAAKVEVVGADCQGVNGLLTVDMGNYQINGDNIVWNNYSVAAANGTVVSSGAITSNLITLSNLPEGTYTVVVDMNGYQATRMVQVDNMDMVAAVFVPSTVAAYVGDDIAFGNYSSGATTYTWNFGDGTTDVTATPVHSYAAAGEYEVVLTATNGDCSSSYTQMLKIGEEEVVDGIDNDEMNTVNVFSTGNLVNINFAAAPGVRFTVDVMDMTGRKVINEVTMDGLSQQYSIELPAIADGVYFVRLNSEAGVIVRQVFIGSSK